MNKKYLPSALILYLNYFIHGVGCSILGQAVIKEALAGAWGVEAMAITAISAAFRSRTSDRTSICRTAFRQTWTPHFHSDRKCFLCDLPDRSCTSHLMPEQTAATQSLMYVQSSVVSQTRSLIPVSTRQFPRSSSKAPGVATMGIKFFIAIAQMLLPFVLGATVATTATGHGTSYNPSILSDAVLSTLVLFVLVFLFPLPDADQKAAGKTEGLIDSLKHTHFSFESIAMILIGFTCTGTFQLWLNCAQNFAKENVRLG